MKNVIITGASGLLGKYLYEYWRESKVRIAEEIYEFRNKPGNLLANWPSDSYSLKTLTESNVIPFTRNPAPIPMVGGDIKDKTIENITGTINHYKAEIFIHCAAIGDVDYTEKHPEECNKINVSAVENLAIACGKSNCKLVYISSNAVFDGDHAPYKEYDERKPVNKYGELKCRAEDAVLLAKDWLIIRPIFLYGWPFSGRRGNWVTKIIETLPKKEKLYMVDDVITQPTYAKDCAEIIWRLIDKNNDIYHVAAEKTQSIYDFAVETAGVFGLDAARIEHCLSTQYQAMAPRPKNTTFDLTKMKNTLNVTISDNGLQRMKEEK